MDRDLHSEVNGLLEHDRRKPSGSLPPLRTVTAVGRRLSLHAWPNGDVEMIGACLPMARIVSRDGDKALALRYVVTEGARLLTLKDVRQLGIEYLSATVVSDDFVR